jgi:hypothetical protein
MNMVIKCAAGSLRRWVCAVHVQKQLTLVAYVLHVTELCRYFFVQYSYGTVRHKMITMDGDALCCCLTLQYCIEVQYGVNGLSYYCRKI